MAKSINSETTLRPGSVAGQMSTWKPILIAPHGVSLLTRTGANLMFGYCYAGVWRRDDGKRIEPQLWLEVAP